MSRTVWFYRDYVRLYGGHVKHSHYFDHVRRMSGFEPRITFSGPPTSESLARARRLLWPHGPGMAAEAWEPAGGDVFFLAGVDWRYINQNGLVDLPNPRINLVQHVRHAYEKHELYGYLTERAVRICVSQEVADAVSATGRANGPVLTIPNGVDLVPFEPMGSGSPVGFEERPSAATIIGYKRPDLARRLSGRLDSEGVEHRLVTEFLDRGEFLELLAGSRVAVCLPRAEEGFFLPALEALASGCLLVTLDCVGNRGFCLHDRNCLVADPDLDDLCAATKRALAMPPAQRGRMHREARETVARHSLEAERARFHAVLRDLDRLWRDARNPPAKTPPPPQANRMARTEAGDPRPLLGFMIVGAQRCGTTALSRFLSRHPEIGMSNPKEVHLFDRPNYSPGWTVEQIDARYRPCFEDRAGVRIRGEATPIYLFFPEIARELKRYNPELKLIVLLRDPVERAISSYYLERNRSREPRPLWRALLMEPLRMRRCRDPLAYGSLTRVCSYRRRGLYSLQLRNLYRSFDREQVLIVRSRDLSRHHDAVLRRVFAFLGVSEEVRIAPEFVNHAERAGRTHRAVSWLLRLSFLPEFVRMRTMARSNPDLAEGEGRPPVS